MANCPQEKLTETYYCESMSCLYIFLAFRLSVVCKIWTLIHTRSSYKRQRMTHNQLTPLVRAVS